MSERLWLGALLIGLSAIVRPQGVWLPPVFALLMVGLAARKRISWGKALAASALSGLGAVFLIAWYWCEAGDPFYYLKIQASGAYGRTFSLWGGIWSHHPRWDTAVLYLYLSLAGAVRLIRRKDLPSKFLGWATLAFTEVPLFFGGFYSYVRFLSVSLGMFMYLAEKSERSRLAEMGIVVFFLTKLAIQVYKSGYHEWVG